MHNYLPEAVLRPGGSVLVEIGAGIGEAVRQVMEDGGAFQHAGTWSDPADPHDRVMQFMVSNTAESAMPGSVTR